MTQRQLVVTGIILIAFISFGWIINANKSEYYTSKHIPPSFLEWLDNKFTKKNGFTSTLTVKESISGTVVKAVAKKGRVEGLQYYFTGIPGYYEYDSYIILENETGERLPVYFSPTRTKNMKVVLITGEQVPFSSLQKGDRVTIREEVDAQKDNRDDKNLIQLIVEIER